MAVKNIIKKNMYFDSVSLMVLSTQANAMEGVEQAMIAMGTELNKEVIRDAGLGCAELGNAGPSDLIIAIKTTSDERAQTIVDDIEELFTKKKSSTNATEVTHISFDSALEANPEANLAIISVPGVFAAREAHKALDKGLNVMIFSDNVSIEDEVSLKQSAHAKGLLCMGPDCGTAMFNGKGICFANAIRSGNIGIVGASGTGSQEIAARVHGFGGGISHLIGTGGRDLSEAVGGIMMIDALHLLQADDATEVIVLVSKQPAKSVEEKIFAEIKKSQKPVVVCFIGSSPDALELSAGVYAEHTKDAALKAVILAGKAEETINKHSLNLPLIEEVKAKLNPEQKYIRALLCGGTLCEEMAFLAKQTLDDVYSNIDKDPKHQLENINVSKGHTFIDFGDDEFTKGKPHPMIDPSLRIARFLEEAKDPEVGTIILDFILGYGAHSDPVGVMIPAIIEAKEYAKSQGYHLEILGYVLGTERDPQNFDEQVQKLLDADVTWASSCANSGLLARGFVAK